MAYEKQKFIDGVTVLSAKHLECIEDCLCEQETKCGELDNLTTEHTDCLVGAINEVNGLVKDLSEKTAELEQPAISVNLTAYESDGIIVETYTDGSQKTYTMEFDADGNPTSITDSDGNVTTLEW